MRKKRKWGQGRGADAIVILMVLTCCAATAVRAEEVSGSAVQEMGAESEADSWRIWDKPDLGMEQKERLSGTLAEKTAAWRARMKAAAAARGEEEDQQEQQREVQQESQWEVHAETQQESQWQVQQEAQRESQWQVQQETQRESQWEAQQETQRESQWEIRQETQQNQQWEIQQEINMDRAETAEYIFPDGDTRYLTQDEVEALSLQAACYAKNEFYARHGRQFQSRELQEYFGEKSWYMGFIAPEEFPEEVFNVYEKANIILIRDWEYTLSDSGYPLDQEGYDIYSF